VTGADEAEVDVRLVHPFQARKTYLCPGCNQEIPIGVAHLVVVPRDDPAERRHWHRPCWERRASRRPGRA
jgi:ABC-type tungstate transport system permease subunit